MAVVQGDIVRVTARLIGEAGQAVQNVYYLRQDGLGSVVDSLVDDDIGAWLEEMYTEILSDLNGAMVFDSYIVHNMTRNITYDAFAWPTLTNGGGSGQALAPGVSGLVTLNTLVSGVRGRKYLGVFGEPQGGNGRWEASVLTDMAAYATHLIGSFLGAASANSWLPGVVAKNGDFWAFESARVVNNAAYQRRRRFGVGV